MSEVESPEKFAKRLEYTLSCANDLDRDTARLLIAARDAAIAAAAREAVIRECIEAMLNDDWKFMGTNRSAYVLRALLPPAAAKEEK